MGSSIIKRSRVFNPGVAFFENQLRELVQKNFWQGQEKGTKNYVRQSGKLVLGESIPVKISLPLDTDRGCFSCRDRYTAVARLDTMGDDSPPS